MKFKNKKFSSKTYQIKNSGEFENAVEDMLSISPEEAKEIREAYPLFEEHLIAEGKLTIRGGEFYYINDVCIMIASSIPVKVIKELTDIVGKNVRLFMEVEPDEDEE